MSRRPTIRRGAFVILLAVGVAGCVEPPPLEPQLPVEQAAIHVDKTTQTHIVQLDRNGRAPVLEKRRLEAFIADLGGKRPDALHFTIRAVQPDRAREIANVLIAGGVEPSKIAIMPSGAGSAKISQVSVIIDQYVAVAPECPLWSTGPVATNDNSTRSNLGCDNQANLAAMVADPRDLTGGASRTKADGVTGAAAVQRYHEDKVKALPKEDETLSSTGSGQGVQSGAGGASP